MNNTVKLTDDELSVIIASLDLIMKSYDIFIQNENKPDTATIQAYKVAKLLFERLNKEYFYGSVPTNENPN